MGSNLWVEERTEDSVINRICECTSDILLPEKKFVSDMLSKKLAEYVLKKQKGTMTTEESAEFEELKEANKEFLKFIDRTIKDHQKTKFAKSVINFFHHKIIDAEFMDKININNHHLLPLRTKNLNLKIEKDRRKLYDYQNKYFLNTIKNYPYQTLNYIFYKSAQTLILEPFGVYKFIKTDLTVPQYWKLASFKSDLIFNVIYSFIIYFIIFVFTQILDSTHYGLLKTFLRIHPFFLDDYMSRVQNQ
jgi:hypothetical protein